VGAVEKGLRDVLFALGRFGRHIEMVLFVVEKIGIN
jgi:hypothetical protein